MRPKSSKANRERFADPGDTIYDFMAQGILVECPDCGGCATHRPIAAHVNTRDWFAPRRLICPVCSLAREWPPRTAGQPDRGISWRWYETPARDAYFGALLWIRGRFGAKEIWAYNWAHLDLIESHVAATHRIRGDDRRPPPYPRTFDCRTFLSRLPKWIVSAKNRDQVLATIARIREVRGTQGASTPRRRK